MTETEFIPKRRKKIGEYNNPGKDIPKTRRIV